MAVKDLGLSKKATNGWSAFNNDPHPMTPEHGAVKHLGPQFGTALGKHAGAYDATKDTMGAVKSGGFAYGKHSADYKAMSTRPAAASSKQYVGKRRSSAVSGNGTITSQPLGKHASPRIPVLGGNTVGANPTQPVHAAKVNGAANPTGNSKGRNPRGKSPAKLRIRAHASKYAGNLAHVLSQMTGK